MAPQYLGFVSARNNQPAEVSEQALRQMRSLLQIDQPYRRQSVSTNASDLTADLDEIQELMNENDSPPHPNQAIRPAPTTSTADQPMKRRRTLTGRS